MLPAYVLIKYIVSWPREALQNTQFSYYQFKGAREKERGGERERGRMNESQEKRSGIASNVTVCVCTCRMEQGINGKYYRIPHASLLINYVRSESIMYHEMVLRATCSRCNHKRKPEVRRERRDERINVRG